MAAVRVIWILFQVFLLAFIVLETAHSRSFTIDYQKNTFMKDGEPFRYIASVLFYTLLASYFIHC